MLTIKEEDIDRITEVFYHLIKGKTPSPIELPPDYPDNELKQLVEYINRFLVDYTANSEFAFNLGKGNVDAETPRNKSSILQALKSLQASLRHLTWTTQQISKGDFSHEVSFMGDFSDAFNNMTKQLQNSFNERDQATQELENQIENLARARRAMLNIMEDLDEAKAKAEEATKAKSDFLANMSHEIRTPMNAILGMTHLAMQTELTPQQADYLKKTHSSAKSLLGLINDILDFSKIEAGKMDMETVDFHLDDVLENVSTMISIKAEEKGLKLVFETPDELPKNLIGDPLRLGQILINLSNNAVKFTSEGGVYIVTALEDESEETLTIRFTVRDTGIGLTGDQIGKLFQSFSQADTSTTRKYGGTGLGLTISKRLVEMMNGKIWVESEPGEGSSFIFTAMFGRSKETGRSSRTAGGKGVDRDSLRLIMGAQILLVEDNEINQQVAAELLEKSGFLVDISENGQRAVEAVDQKSYDIVLMDIQMPVMDGYEATKQIRQKPDLSDLPILAMSASAMTQDVESAREAGMNDHVSKPIDPARLLEALQEWIKPGDRPLPEGFQEGVAPAVHTADDLPDLPGIDVQTGVLRVGGSVKSYRNLLNRFVQNQSQAIKRIRQSMAEGDSELSVRLAHTLKGVAGNIGATSLFEVAQELEASLKAGQNPGENGLLQKAEASLDDVVSLISELKPEDSGQAEAAESLELDPEAIRPLLKTLRHFLNEDDTEAIDLVQQLKPYFKSSPASQQLDTLERHISSYNFEAALEQLNMILDTVGVSL